ncbi:type IV pilus modification protein PilV [Aquabacterium sp.]|uniref:type IV pilus modification protein PilV n=1 Tax=Aquabacterium sp. TaxID=1872578 RepID=UPI0027B93E7D|nr:type IV pilus modification protein PilV [Aquabacterium sp.]
MPRPFLARQRGATLVEVLMAMLLMSFGVLAMTAMQAHAIQHSQTTESRARATLLAHDLADRMRANTAPVGDWEAYDLTASAAPAAPPLADACQGSAVCTFDEMAAADLAQWQQQLANSLPQGRGHVHTVGTQADVWVIWDEADQAGAQTHDSCPAGLSLGTHTRCLYLRVAL